MAGSPQPILVWELDGHRLAPRFRRIEIRLKCDQMAARIPLGENVTQQRNSLRHIKDRIIGGDRAKYILPSYESPELSSRTRRLKS